MSKGPKIGFVRNDSFIQGFVVQDEATGTPIDISAWEIKFMVKARISDADSAALIDKSCVITDGANGKYEIQLDKSETVATPNSGYVYDIQHTFGGTQRFTVTGACEIYQDVRQNP
jgi:hypothetical protein